MIGRLIPEMMLQMAPGLDVTSYLERTRYAALGAMDAGV
jgi:hypothetical protein